MKRLALIALPVVLAILFAAAFAWWYVLSIERVEMVVNVTGESLIGFNAATDKLYFGSTVPGGGGQRFAVLSSEVPARVVLQIEGPIAAWISLSRDEIWLEPGNRERVTFTLTVPESAKEGEYKGNLTAAYYRTLPFQSPEHI